jgi:hypothetical protein
MDGLTGKKSGVSARDLHAEAMIKTSLAWLLFGMLMTTVGAAETGFWRQLTPEERRAAGVEQLTPDQQAALDVLAGRYAREGARQAREQVKQEVREEAKAEARKEVKQEVREEVRRELKTDQKVHEEARLGLPAEEKDAVTASRIIGRFNGWSGGTVFRLENGQTWAQSNGSDSLWVPTMENPEVEIRSSKLGGWKLYLKGKGFWLRVRRLK